MICRTLTSGRGIPCIIGAAGIKAVSFSEYGENLIISSNGTVNSFAPGLTASYRYLVKPSGNSYSEKVITENRNRLYSGTLNIVLHKLDVQTRNEVNNLIARELIVFIEDFNGNVYCIGFGNGAVVTDGEFATGDAKSDLYGTKLTLTTDEVEPYLTLGATAVTAYKALVVNGL